MIYLDSASPDDAREAAEPGFVAAAGLAGRDVTCAITAIYSPAQAVAAGRVLPVGDSLRRRRGAPPPAHGERRVGARLGAEARSADRDPDASIKSASQAVQAMRDGAAAVSMSLGAIRELGEHELSQAAIEELDRTAAGASAA